MSEGKEVAVVDPKGTAVVGYDYGEASGEGFEGTASEDLSIPFIGVFQALSPQVSDDNPKGSRPGMLFNTVTRQLHDPETGIVFLPVHKEVAYVEWVPRDNGGGFVGMHDPNGDIVKAAIADNDGQKFGKLKTGENDLIETYYMYGLILNEEGTAADGFAVISFTSTKIKPFRDWITAMYTLKGRPPMWANRAVIRSVKQTNKNQQDFFNFQIDPLKDTWGGSLIDPKANAELLEEARDFRKMVVTGMARAAFDTENAAGGAEASAGSEEDAPF